MDTKDGAPCLSREEVRAYDRWAERELGLPGCVLMENAGRGAAEAVLALLAEIGRPRGPAAVLCGGGNNGGDGYVVARHLANAGVGVALYSAVSAGRLEGDAALFRDVAERIGLAARPLVDADDLGRARADLGAAAVIVDALLGTGFEGELRPPLARVVDAVRAARARGARVVALDVPSGLDCDTGRAAHPTVQADLTVTFVALKRGFGEPAAREHLGRVLVRGIGAPPPGRALGATNL